MAKAKKQAAKETPVKDKKNPSLRTDLSFEELLKMAVNTPKKKKQ